MGEVRKGLILALNAPDKASLVASCGGLIALADLDILQHVTVVVSSGWGNLLAHLFQQVRRIDYSGIDLSRVPAFRDEQVSFSPTSDLGRLLSFWLLPRVYDVAYSNQEGEAMRSYLTGCINPFNADIGVRSTYNEALAYSRECDRLARMPHFSPGETVATEESGLVVCMTASDEAGQTPVLLHNHTRFGKLGSNSRTNLHIGYTAKPLVDVPGDADKLALAASLPIQRFSTFEYGDQEIGARADLDPLLQKASDLLFHLTRMAAHRLYLPRKQEHAENRCEEEEEEEEEDDEAKSESEGGEVQGTRIMDEIKAHPLQRLVLLDCVRGNTAVLHSIKDLVLRAEHSFHDLCRAGDSESVRFFRKSCCSLANDDFVEALLRDSVEMLCQQGYTCSGLSTRSMMYDLTDWGYLCTRKAFEQRS
jgi:hypothetical protein